MYVCHLLAVGHLFHKLKACVKLRQTFSACVERVGQIILAVSIIALQMVSFLLEIKVLIFTDDFT